jgi:hypothetical protein
MKMKSKSCIVGSFFVFSTLLLHGCTTPWEDSGTFFRTAQTVLNFESTPNGQVFLNNRYVGNTPVTVPVEYQQEVQKKTRKVSYWVTQPGWSLLVSIASLGIYLPFSLIPVDIETSLEPLDSFKDNEFDVRVVSEGYYDWGDKVLCSGQDKRSLRVPLKERR